MKPRPPPYARSVVQAAIHNKSRVLEALLTTIPEGHERTYLINEVDEENHRNAVMYCAMLGDSDSLELLAAADASFNISDVHCRTAMHYAAMNDSSKLIEAVFLPFKSAGKAV